MQQSASVNFSKCWCCWSCKVTVTWPWNTEKLVTYIHINRFAKRLTNDKNNCQKMHWKEIKLNWIQCKHLVFQIGFYFAEIGEGYYCHNFLLDYNFSLEKCHLKFQHWWISEKYFEDFFIYFRNHLQKPLIFLMQDRLQFQV